MNFVVLVGDKQGEVLYTIIGPVPVDVVNMLPTLERTAKMLFHYQSVFPDAFVAVPNVPVP